MDILPVVGERNVVVDYVLSEASIVYEDDSAGNRQRVPVDFTPVIEAGVLEVVQIEATEQPLFVDLAIELDDGEAKSGAIAISRGWAMATDEKPALRIMSGVAPQVNLLKTPDIIWHWASVTHPTDDEVRSVITSIRRGAAFTCQNGHQHRDWWCQYEQ